MLCSAAPIRNRGCGFGQHLGARFLDWRRDAARTRRRGRLRFVKAAFAENIFSNQMTLIAALCALLPLTLLGQPPSKPKPGTASETPVPEYQPAPASSAGSIGPLPAARCWKTVTWLTASWRRRFIATSSRNFAMPDTDTGWPLTCISRTRIGMTPILRLSEAAGVDLFRQNRNHHPHAARTAGFRPAEGLFCLRLQAAAEDLMDQHPIKL